MSINYELFAKQVQKKALELIKERHLPCNAIGVGIEEDPEKGPVFLLALDMDRLEEGSAFRFAMHQVIEKGIDGFAEEIADVVQHIAGKEASFPYLVDYEIGVDDGIISNAVGCYTLNQAKEIAEFIFEGYKKTSSTVFVRVINDEGIIEAVF